MEDKQISYYQHEEEINRLENHNKRAYALTIIIFIALIATNGAWLIHESMYEDVVTEQTVSSDGSGDINLNGVGDVYYGYSSDTESQETGEKNP